MQLFFIMLSKRDTHNSNISIMYQYYALYHYVNIYHVFHVLFMRFMLFICIVYGDEHVCLCQIKYFLLTWNSSLYDHGMCILQFTSFKSFKCIHTIIIYLFNSNKINNVTISRHLIYYNIRSYKQFVHRLNVTEI